MPIDSLACRIQVSQGHQTFEVWDSPTGKVLYQYQELNGQVRVHPPQQLSPEEVQHVFEKICRMATETVSKAKGQGLKVETPPKQ